MNCTSLTRFSMMTDGIVITTSVLTVNNTERSFENCPNLIDVEIGSHSVEGVGNIRANVVFLKSWYPLNVCADATETATMNANIRDHIAANCFEGSYTITFSKNLQNYLETATVEAFTNKGWTVAYA